MPKNQTTARTVSEEVTITRRRRYARSPTEALCVSLTPVRMDILRFLAELRFLSLPQIARLCCPSPRQDLAEKSARRQMRLLFDAGLVDVIPVSRAALSPVGLPNDASLLYGSAPNIYAPTALGLETLYRAGLIDTPLTGRKKPAYGPKNSLFLAHELAVWDVRVWIEVVARNSGHRLESWQAGEDAVIALERTQSSFSVRPDAWFVLRLERAALVGLVEVDRGTERGDRRWCEKLIAYSALMSGPRLRDATGYVNARILVICPNVRRREGLADLIGRNATHLVAQRFWLTERVTLDLPDLTRPTWQRPGSQFLQPLIPSSLLKRT